MSWLARLPGFRASYALRDATAKLGATKRELHTANEDRARLAAEIKTLQAHAVSLRRLKDILQAHAATYRAASPFPHAVIDDFLDPAVAQTVLDEFERMDRGGWHYTDRPTERKWSTEDVLQLGPRTRSIIHQLNAGPFLQFLEQLTGISGLIADPHLRGGGLHEIRRGGTLGVHADFNFYERLSVYRRLNLLIYLNRDWQEQWGGHLQLWDRDGKSCVERIAPTFNRAVIFDTSNFSYHGHPDPLECPPDRSRKSIALYYYTVDYPYAEDRMPHTTVFLEHSH